MNTKRTLIRHILYAEDLQGDIFIQGLVRTRREGKGFTFIEVNDGSVIDSIQVIADENVPGYDRIHDITTGSSVGVKGEIVLSPGKGQKYEIRADEVILYGEAPPDSYPLQKKCHSFEFLREIAHLRPRTNTFGAVMRVRNALCFAIHRFFQEKGFLYIHTPIITASDCEGAGEMFRVSTLDPANMPFSNGNVDYSRDFFGKKTGLSVSGQLEAELLATALGSVYTFGPTFRAENSNTTRHLSEFWMVEPEMAYAELSDNIETAQEFLKYIFQYCLDHCAPDMEFFDTHIQKGIIDSLKEIIESDFAVISYTEAVEILEKSGEQFEYPVEWGRDLQSEHERYITEKKFHKPVVVIDYPKSIKPFYMRVNDDHKTVRAMDVLVPGIGEIIGGSERESRLDVLTERMKEMDLEPDEYWWYLDIRRYGSIPHSGFGLGLERTLQFITGMQNIRDVIPFPRAPRSAEF